MKTAFQYNFRIGPEAIWLIVNTVLGTLVVDVLARLVDVNSPAELGDISSWLWGLGFGGVRTALGALLAAATGGGFQAPGEPKESATGPLG